VAPLSIGAAPYLARQIQAPARGSAECACGSGLRGAPVEGADISLLVPAPTQMQLPVYRAGRREDARQCAHDVAAVGDFVAAAVRGTWRFDITDDGPHSDGFPLARTAQHLPPGAHGGARFIDAVGFAPGEQPKGRSRYRRPRPRHSNSRCALPSNAPPRARRDQRRQPCPGIPTAQQGTATKKGADGPVKPAATAPKPTPLKPATVSGYQPRSGYGGFAVVGSGRR